jgi:hypothetical protein
VKARGIPVKNIRLKDGKLEPVTKYRSVSDKIRARSSRKIKVKRRTP